ncbi:hypothetical protein RCL1_006253 [Eukaryota sp. TZLM3-RCL]
MHLPSVARNQALRQLLLSITSCSSLQKERSCLSLVLNSKQYKTYPVRLHYTELWMLLKSEPSESSRLLSDFCTNYSKAAPLHIAAFLGATHYFNEEEREVLLKTLENVIEFNQNSEDFKKVLLVATVDCLDDVDYSMLFSVLVRIKSLVSSPLNSSMELSLKELQVIFTEKQIIFRYSGGSDVENCRFCMTLILLFYRFYYMNSGEIVFIIGKSEVLFYTLSIVDAWTCCDDVITEVAGDLFSICK